MTACVRSVGDGHTYGFANVSEPRFYDPAEGRLQRSRERFAGFGGAVQDYPFALESDELHSLSGQ